MKNIALLFLMLPYSSLGSKTLENGCLSEQAAGLPCTDQFVKELAMIPPALTTEADAGWRAAFAISSYMFTAYKNYKSCLQKTYPDGNAP